MDQQPFNEYVRTFIQRHPYYIVKWHGKDWRTKKKALSDRPIQAHLEGKYSVGVLGQWYPLFINLDIDERSMEEAEEIRNELGANESNSALYTSESLNSYHLLLRPIYNGEPRSLSLNQEVLRSFARIKGIEVYPQRNRCVRLPFGPVQQCLDEGREHLRTWEEKFYWFQKLDEFELSTVPQHQMILPIEPSTNIKSLRLGSYQEGLEYLETGLLEPSTRDHACFCIIFYLWRKNIHPDTTRDIVWRWLQQKNNGLSKTFRNNPEYCRRDIAYKVQYVYTRFDSRGFLPDSTHNNHRGYITKSDIERIIQVSRGNLPRMKFTYELVKYAYPRRYRDILDVPSKELRKWAGTRTVNTYLDDLHENKIINRGSSYVVGFRSKSMSINWPFNSTDEAIMYEGRAVDSFKDAVQLVFSPEEFTEKVKAAGATPDAARMMRNNIFLKEEYSTSILSVQSA